MIHDNDLLGPQPHQAVCEGGTVGHAGDPLPYQTEGGATLVKVTLFRGSPPGAPRASDGGANGYRILARMAPPLWHVPDAGTQVVVVFPGGLIETPGAGVLWAAGGADPSAAAPGTAVLNFAGRRLIIIADEIQLIGGAVEGMQGKVTTNERGVKLEDPVGGQLAVEDTFTKLNGDDSTSAMLTGTAGAEVPAPRVLGSLA